MHSSNGIRLLGAAIVGIVMAACVHNAHAGVYTLPSAGSDGIAALERQPLLSRGNNWADDDAALDEYTRRIKRQQIEAAQAQNAAAANEGGSASSAGGQQSQSSSSSGGGGQSDAIIRFQDYLLQAKSICARELRYDGDVDKSLLYEPLPTPQEKCLMECILKRTDLMQPNNRLSIQRIGSIAELVSGRNPLVVSIAMATADHCNRFIDASNPCEAAAQINQCIANELKARKIKLFY